MDVDESGSTRGEGERGGHRVAWFHQSRPVAGGTVYTHADGEDGVHDEADDSDF